MPTTMRLPCSVEIIEAAADSSALHRLKILAYSGGITDGVLGWGPLAFDLSTIKLGAAEIPILAGHDDTLDGIAGRGRAHVAGGQLFVEGTLSSATLAAQKILALSKEGHKFQASVGLASPVSWEFIRPGDSLALNGRVLKAGPGGFKLIRNAKLREVSILPMGADDSTAVQIAARAYFVKGQDMSQLQVEPVDQDKAAAEIQAAESERVAVIGKLCGSEHPEIMARAVKEGWDARKTELECLRASRPKLPASVFFHNAPDPLVPNVLAAAVLLHAGRSSLAEKSWGGRVVQQAADLRARSLVDILGACLLAEGRQIPTGRMDMIRAGFSTDAAAVAFGSGIEKVAIAAYLETPATWASFAAIKSVRNFREATGIRPSFTGNLEQLSPAGEIKHGALDEATYPFHVDTRAKMLRLTRQAVINDDLGIVNDAAAAYGAMARRAVNDLVWTVILGNAGSHFHADHGNLLTGATTNLGLVGLTAAVAAMRMQRDAEHNDLDISPAVLCVPPELEIVARTILDSVQIQAAEGDAMGNALEGIAKLEVESRISNTAKFTTGASGTQWFLFANPVATPVVCAFLEGKQTPTVEFFGLDSEPNTLGISWRVYHDFGAALGDWRAGVRSDGI